MITIGADPELFLRKNGIPHTGYGLIEGDKENPLAVNNGAVQVDGMALEFNIDPANSFEEFNNSIETVMEQLWNMIPPEYQFDIVPSTSFPDEHMEIMPEEALILGCDPDFNAYTGDTNPAPEAHPNMRVAGGHVHIGFTEGADVQDPQHFLKCRTLTKQLDYLLGLPSLICDNDNRRREMYGKAGAFRPKPYGMEYRVLSNFWIKNADFRRLVFNNSRLAVNLLMDGLDFSVEYGELARDMINGNNAYEAEMFLADLEDDHDIRVMEGI